jgi:predicted nucleic acid-binding protein
MVLYYFDASALVKYYVTEPGSTWVRQIIDEQDPETGQSRHIILIAEITRVETAAGFAVIERIGRMGKAARDRAYRRFMSQLTHRYAIIPLTSEDIEPAAHLTQQYPLKAYDAVQLAVALRYHRLLTGSPHTCIFVSGDTPLINAARAEGLSIDNPFDHVVLGDAPRRSV